MSEQPKKRGITDALAGSANGGCSSCGKMRGLGDAVARMTSAVGIKPCGACKKRQEMLNKMLPFGNPQNTEISEPPVDQG